jgi:hypothetical protein
MSWVLLGIRWRRSVNIERTLSQSGLIDNELLRRLAHSCAAAKLLLDACPESRTFLIPALSIEAASASLSRQ